MTYTASQLERVRRMVGHAAEHYDLAATLEGKDEERTHHLAMCLALVVSAQGPLKEISDGLTYMVEP